MSLKLKIAKENIGFRVTLLSANGVSSVPPERGSA